ncbi:hypothetical protein [Rhodococcoides fascians]|uniref:hypothetical protein n=1 Tax=Rhodococcoides fascians TaxID=1828 RepID=UPI0012D356DB|nr:hypothetical protein [Rhodococcus fascians]
MSIAAYKEALAAGQDMDSYEPPRNRCSREFPFELYITSNDPKVIACLYQNSFATEDDARHELDRLTSAGGDRIYSEDVPGRVWTLQYREWETRRMTAKLDWADFAHADRVTR